MLSCFDVVDRSKPIAKKFDIKLLFGVFRKSCEQIGKVIVTTLRREVVAEIVDAEAEKSDRHSKTGHRVTWR